jgi:hypothetical protein
MAELITHIAASNVQLRCQQRQRHRHREQQQLRDPLQGQLRAYEKSCDLATKTVLVNQGWYLASGHWRRRMNIRNKPPTCDLDRADFETIVAAANRGNPEALTRLREVLDENPSLWQSVANLGGHCESILVNLIAGNNVLLRESLQRQVASMKEELSNGDPDILKEMAVQRVVNAWLLVSYVNAVCLAPESMAEIQRQESGPPAVRQGG